MDPRLWTQSRSSPPLPPFCPSHRTQIACPCCSHHARRRKTPTVNPDGTVDRELIGFGSNSKPSSRRGSFHTGAEKPRRYSAHANTGRGRLNEDDLFRKVSQLNRDRRPATPPLSPRNSGTTTPIPVEETLDFDPVTLLQQPSWFSFVRSILQGREFAAKLDCLRWNSGSRCLLWRENTEARQPRQLINV
eukprot:GABV01000090.1.p2 GENE.GABV01000090.1~~GABV01000090.1.p2  ORF type:complete len:190 (-),score=36.65 GABV01000090.1:1209-1778(-)